MTREDGRPRPADLLRELASEARRGASLRVYLQYASGAGATTTMLDEARRRAGRGTDVVVAACRLHGDDVPTGTAGLEALGGARQRGERLRLDPSRLLARNPEVACIDDLAEPDVDGRPAWESLPRLLRAGITVLATLHLLSLRTIAAGFRETARAAPGMPLVDDGVLSTIDELELVDVPPDELIERLRDGRVVRPADLARMLQGELRPNVLRALREAAFRLIAEHADRRLVGYLRESGVSSPWEARGNILLCISIRPGLEGRIRRVGRMATVQDAHFRVVTVRRRGLTDEEKLLVGGYAALAHQLGGRFTTLRGRSIASTIAAYVRASLATEVVLGHRGGRWRPGDTTSELIRHLSGVDVHILASEDAGVHTMAE